MNEQKRLSLEDFKLRQVDNVKEIDKLLGGLAAACHQTCNPDPPPDDWLDWVDYTA